MIFFQGNQLFDPELFKNQFPSHEFHIFMREDKGMCHRYKFHKHKLILILAGMRTYAEELRSYGYQVHYEKIDQQQSGDYFSAITNFIKVNEIKSVVHYELEDKFFEDKLKSLFNELNLEVKILNSPMFLTSRTVFQDYLKSVKSPQMRHFYEKQRKRLKILITKDLKPIGDQWSFDTENRKALTKNIIPPELPRFKKTKIILEVEDIIEIFFPDHSGKSTLFWLPVSRSEAKEWLDHFILYKLSEFGPYEDAIPQRSDFVFHSVLTPFLNTGLLTPKEVLIRVLDFHHKKPIPLPSLEGFIRQIIGWREFIRGIYQNYSEVQESTNFWNHQNKLSPNWYEGHTGIPPLDNMIQKTNRYAYAHHIERLMVAGNLMLLTGIHPHEAHRWFMEMFIDSAPWVMGPNVYGMALFSDGGIFATKPYICGSNYFCKMGGYKKEDWCHGVDGLYWRFIDSNRKYFLTNPRLSMSVRSLDKMDKFRKREIYQAADDLLAKLVL